MASLVNRNKKHTRLLLWGGAFTLLLLGYGLHFFFSLIPTGGDHERSLAYVARMEEELALRQLFAAEGAELVAVSPIMNGRKEYGATFHLKKGSPCIIPAAVHTYVAGHPERSHGRAITVSACSGEYWAEDTPHCSTTYFWWKLLF